MFLVSGASGNIGGELVRILADAGEPVRALTRSGAMPNAPRGAEKVSGDLDDPASLVTALAGVRGLFLLPGYQDMPGVLAEARRAGVERVVQLSGSSAGSGDTSNAVTAYMMRSEQAARDSGLAWTVLRPFGFMSNALRWLPELKAGDVVREPFPDAAVAVIDPADIASVAAAALLEDGHEGATYLVSGPESLRPADRLLILAAALGRDLRLVGLSPDEARKEVADQMPPQYASAMISFYLDGALDESRPQPTVEQVLGRLPRTFTEWVDAHVEAFR